LRRAEAELKRGTALRAIACHALGLCHEPSVGRRFPQILSDSVKREGSGSEWFREAAAAVAPVTVDALADAARFAGTLHPWAHSGIKIIP
jgi:hypothetical protein